MGKARAKESAADRVAAELAGQWFGTLFDLGWARFTHMATRHLLAHQALGMAIHVREGVRLANEAESDGDEAKLALALGRVQHDWLELVGFMSAAVMHSADVWSIFAQMVRNIDTGFTIVWALGVWPDLELKYPGLASPDWTEYEVSLAAVAALRRSVEDLVAAIQGKLDEADPRRRMPQATASES
jgi:hypothetical protein